MTKGVNEATLFDSAMGKIHDTGEKLGVIFGKRTFKIISFTFVCLCIILFGTLTFLRALGIGFFKKKK